MALISVVEVLDADFCDPVTVVRQHQFVDAGGRIVIVERRIEITASVQSAGADSHVYTPDATRVDGAYDIITVFPLTAASETTLPDAVEWRGARFQIESVQRFGNFAGLNGHYEGSMSFKSLLPPLGPP